MLTRLKVSGFKNLGDIDVSFGPFTCIAGANGAGKSNLLDALRFLAALADRTLLDAALNVRGKGRQAEDVASLFQRIGSHRTDRLSFDAEMLVPAFGMGDMAEKVTASATLLRYRLELGLRDDDSALRGPLELVEETLISIPVSDANDGLPFPRVSPQWRRSALHGEGTSHAFITTEGMGAARMVTLHGEPGRQGPARANSAAPLPRTVLSATSAGDSPTTFLARTELRSWLLLQLEPSALREPDEIWGGRSLGPDGSHLPGALYSLAQHATLGVSGRRARHAAEERVYAEVAGRLRELVDDVSTASVVRDQERGLLTLYVTDRDGARHPARSLSDGSLRSLALAVLSLGPAPPSWYGYTLLGLEEPENGVSPDRIPALIRLLRGIATDVGLPAGLDNPLRQVIVTTHSPAVVTQVPDDSLLIADRVVLLINEGNGQGARFSALPGTWGQHVPGAAKPAPLGALLTYLNPVPRTGDAEADGSGLSGATPSGSKHERRVVDREDLRRLGAAPRRGE